MVGYIGVLVTTQASKQGSSIRGNVAGIAVLKVDNPAAYQPDPGHGAMSTIIAVLGAGR